jgi:hypothetical protein
VGMGPRLRGDDQSLRGDGSKLGNDEDTASAEKRPHTKSIEPDITGTQRPPM